MERDQVNLGFKVISSVQDFDIKPVFSDELVEGDGLEPSLPAYQTGILPLEEPSFRLERSGGHAHACNMG